MSIFWIFFFIITFCLYVLFGLYITEGINVLSSLILTWIIYTCLWLTFANVFMLGYFWSTIRNKRGPTGMRGIQGEKGDIGIEGSCGIDTSRAALIQDLNTYIDKLYSDKKGVSILNTESQKFPCMYLNNKIRTIAGSRQYIAVVATLSSQEKPIGELINYIKSIWKIWFDLIYEANQEWFTDEYAEEEYNWTGNNPFNEIKKYDIFYWGITRTFRPLKAEICRSSSVYESSKLPIKPQARLKIISSNDYRRIVGDDNTHGINDSQWWEPNEISVGSDMYYPVGQVISTTGNSDWNVKKTGQTIVGDMSFTRDGGDSLAVNNPAKYNGPDIKTILVAGDVKLPVNVKRIACHGRNCQVASERLECPEGYESVGDVVGGNGTNAKTKARCLPSDCLTPLSNRGYVMWYAREPNRHYVINHDTRGEKNALGDNGYNLFRVDDKKPFYRIKDKCLEPPSVPSTKDTETEFTDLGVGWFGHPYKMDPRYSIFTFLGLVPEGLIIHKSSGRRFYILHYGGESVNIYNVLEYSPKTDKFNDALQVSNAGNSGVESRPLSRRDERQQWNIIIQNDKRFIKLKNLMNKKYLYLGLEPITGNPQFSTINLDNDVYRNNPIYNNLTPTNINDNTTFSFVSAYGTQMDIIDNTDSSTQVVIGNRVRISTQKKQPISIFGVFIYNQNGVLLNMTNNNAYSSSIYQNHDADNALKIVYENTSRTIGQAISSETVLSKPKGWNTWTTNGTYCAHTNWDGGAATGGDWWEYKFQTSVKISGLEIYFRDDCCPERYKNATIEIFNDGVHNTPSWVFNTGTDKYNSSTITLLIEKNGKINHKN